MTKANGINIGKSINGEPVQPNGGKFGSRNLATVKGKVPQSSQEQILPEKISLGRECDTTASRKAAYLFRGDELELKNNDAKIHDGNYALISEKYGDNAIEIYKNAYQHCVEISGDSEKAAEYGALCFVKSFTAGYEFVFKEYGTTAAQIYERAFLQAIWRPNSTLEETRTCALDSAKSFTAGYESVFKESGTTAAQIYEKAFLKAIGNPNGTMENAKTYAVNSAKGYSYAAECNLPLADSYATSYADYIDRNVVMKNDTVIKAMTYARASIGFSARMMDPGAYAEEYSKIYVAKFNEFVGIVVDFNRAHSLARGYAHAVMELKYEGALANSIAEGYAYAREHGFNDEQARAFPSVQSIYGSTFRTLNFGAKFQILILKDLVNAYVEAKKRAAIFHKSPKKMYGYAEAYTKRYAQERAKFLLEERKAGNHLTKYDNIYDRSSAMVKAQIVADKWLKNNTSKREGASHHLEIMLNGFHPTPSNLSKVYNEVEDSSSELSEKYNEVEDSSSNLPDEYNEDEDSSSELSDEYNEVEDEDYTLEFPEIRMNNTN
jgi:hypothetical protein